MSYTIQAARYANAEQTAAVINTREAADVLISEKDTPSLWRAMLAQGGAQPYRAPEPDYRAKRAAEYPPLGDQLDAIWTYIADPTDAAGRAAAEAMFAQIRTVKAAYPKPEKK